MSIMLDLTPEEVKRSLLREAESRGEGSSRYAEQVAAKLDEAVQRAQGITDDEARDLMLVSAMENVVPQLMERRGHHPEKLWTLLYLVIGVAFVLGRQSEEEAQRDAIREAWGRAGREATQKAQAELSDKGISFFFKQDGVLVEELPDGTIRPAVAPG